MEKPNFRKSIRWILGIVFLLFVVSVGYPVYRNARALNRLNELGGGFYSQHYWFVEKLPWPLKKKLKSIGFSILGSGKRAKYEWAGRYKRIEGYDLRDTGATEEDLKFLLRDQNSVWWLWLEGTRITGVESFRHLTGRILYIEARDTLIEDEAISHLATLDALGELELRGTNVTEQSLPWLLKIPGLKSIRLPASFSDEAVEKLKKANPGASVWREE